MNYFHVILIICFGGILPLFLKKNFRTMRLLGSACIAAGCLAGFFLSVSKLYTIETAFFPYQLALALPFSFAIDPLAAFFLLPLFLVGTSAACYSYQYLDNDQQSIRIAVHYLFFALLIASMTGVLLAASIISFVFCWEAMSVTSATLILFDYEDNDNRRAAFRYFLYTQAGGLFVIASFSLLCSAGGTFELLSPVNLSAGLKLTIFMLALVGFGSKAGLVPMHVWLPHAHPAAPSHISALMSAVMIKIGIYGLLRMYMLAQPDPDMTGRIFITVGAASGILGILYALGQRNLKRLLAYSSIENIGIVLIGLGIGFIGIANHNVTMALLGFTGGLLHIWNHALFKSALFLGAGVVLHETGTLILDRLGGLFKTMPKAGIVFLVCAVAICGVPPFNGFVSEFFIYAAGFQGIRLQNLDLLFMVTAILSLAIIGGLAIACFTEVLGVVFLGENRSSVTIHTYETKPALLFPMTVLALFCIVIGLAPTIFVRLALPVASMLASAPIPASFPAFAFCQNISLGGAGFLALIVAISVLRRLCYRHKAIGQGSTWGCGFTRPTARMQYTASSYARSLLLLFKPFTNLGQRHDAINELFPTASAYQPESHDLVEQFGERYIAPPLTWCSSKLRWIQHGNIQLYIAYIVLAVIVLLLYQAG